MIGDGQEGIRIGWEIDPDHLGLFIDYMVDEPRILVAETVVILPPDMRGQEIIQRRYRSPPGNVAADLQPFGMLIEHRIDDMDKGFITGEHAMAARQEIAFEPPFALMLAQHLHHAAIRRHMIVSWNDLRS